MPLPVIATTVRAAVRGVMGGGNGHWVNVHHFRKTSGAIDLTTLTALNTELQKLYAGPAYGSGLGLLLSCNNSTQLVDCAYTPLDGSSVTTTIAMTGLGSGVVETLPHEVAEVCSHRTALRGRRFRGRTYLPPVTESNTSGAGLLATANITGWQLQWSGFRSALTSLNWEHVIASYVASVATPVTTTLVDPYFDVQRRRKF